MTEAAEMVDVVPEDDVVPKEEVTLSPAQEFIIDEDITGAGIATFRSNDLYLLSDDSGTRDSLDLDTDSIKSLDAVCVESKVDSDIPLKHKHLLTTIAQNTSRRSSLSSLCEHIRKLEIGDDSYESDNQEDYQNDVKCRNCKSSPTISTASNKSSEEFLPSASTLEIIESFAISAPEEDSVTKEEKIEEVEQFLPAISELRSIEIDSSVEKNILTKDSNENTLVAEEAKPTNESISVCGTDTDVTVTPKQNDETVTSEIPSEVISKNKTFTAEDSSTNETEKIIIGFVPVSSTTELDETNIIDTNISEIVASKAEEDIGVLPIIKIDNSDISLEEQTSEHVNYIEENNSLPETTSKDSTAELLEISLIHSSNELDNTVECIAVSLDDTLKDELSIGSLSPLKLAVSENLNTFVTDSEISSIVSPSKLKILSNGIDQKTPMKSGPDGFNKSSSTDTTSAAYPKIVKDLAGGGDIQDNFTQTQSEIIAFGPDTNSNFEMTDMMEKLNQQQAEISDLKLKLNAAQQHNASLELQIRQNEEIVIKTQAEALKTEQNYQQEVKQLKQKVNENSKINEKDTIRELEEQLKETKAREAKLVAEVSQRTKDDQNYQRLLNQYEVQFKTRVSEQKKLREENESTRTHLTNLELAFSDVHSKYEKTKASLQGVKANEETYLAALEVAQSTNVQHEERYESLKAHAKTQIEKSNKEIHDAKEQHDMEINKLRAFIRRLEIKVSSLEVSLQQKTEECEQLSALCDEVTGKKV